MRVASGPSVAHCWVPVEVFPALMGARKCESMVVCDVVLDALCWVVVELM